MFPPSHRVPVRSLVAVVLLSLGAPAPATAQVSECTDQNLLKGARPTSSHHVVRTATITDERAPVEGDNWESEFTALLRNGEAYVEYDLGQIQHIGALILQGDNNDTYEVRVSTDGASYTTAWTVPFADGAGMRTRHKTDLALDARYVRIGWGRGDGYFSLGEVQAFCQRPATWPPRMSRERAAEKREGGVVWWTREVRLSLCKIALGLAGLLVFLGVGWRRWRDHPRYLGTWIAVGATAAITLFTAFMTYTGPEPWRPPFVDLAAPLALAAVTALWVRWLWRRHVARRPWREHALRVVYVTLLITSYHTWINFGTFHGPRTVHLWDSMHYYLGSKYFLENGYEYFYSCAALAEADDGRRDEVLERKYRNLSNNTLGYGDKALVHAEACRERFTPERWAAFQQDLRVFRRLMSPGWFKDAFGDHGYNASPVWNMIGTLISNEGWRERVPPPELVSSPDNEKNKDAAARARIQERFDADAEAQATTLNIIAGIDFSLYAGILLLIWWAFGLQAAALAAVFWAAGHPWAYYWTGGSFGRVPWLFMAVAGVCLLKKGHPLLGAAGITWSALLRVFPAALAGGVTIKILVTAFTDRTVSKTHRLVMAGAVGAVVVLVPASLPSAGGWEAYPGFLENSMKHKATPLTNHMGLPTLFSWHPSYVGRYAKEGGKDDPFERWKELRRETLENRKVVYWAVVLAIFALMASVAKGIEDWEATALSSVFVFGLFELTCYYYSFMVLLAPFALARLRHTVALLGVSVATQIASLAIGWFDERYTFDSLLCGGLVVYFLVDLYVEQRKGEQRKGIRRAAASG